MFHAVTEVCEEKKAANSCNLCSRCAQFSCVLNSVSADRRGMAASRFQAAADVSVILLCFAAEGRKSKNVAGASMLPMVLWQQKFSIVAHPV